MPSRWLKPNGPGGCQDTEDRDRVRTLSLSLVR
jgi:hypothetical protein